ncbi:hypothetical protein ACJ41O_006261 [Fusarium nematophilum]
MNTMRAFVTDGHGSGTVQPVPLPTPGPGEILVKIEYAALNPGDWKLVEGNVAAGPAPQGLISGCDFAGIIEHANGSDWSEGQRVAGFVHGTSNLGTEANPIRGAFAEFISIESALVSAIPENVSLQQASTVPLAYATATQAMYRQLALPKPYQTNTSQEGFLVYGASTSVGQYAVQLGKLSGLRVIAVASSKHHALLKRLGADITVDYRDEAWVARVKEASLSRLRYGLDIIAKGGSSEKIAETLSHTEGDHLVTLSPVNKDSLSAINPHIKSESIMAFTVFGRPLEYHMFDNVGGSTLGDREAWETYLRRLPEMLQKGDLQPNQVKEMGTLKNIVEAFELSKEGKLSAEKAVFKIGS